MRLTEVSVTMGEGQFDLLDRYIRLKAEALLALSKCHYRQNDKATAYLTALQASKAGEPAAASWALQVDSEMSNADRSRIDYLRRVEHKIDDLSTLLKRVTPSQVGQ